MPDDQIAASGQPTTDPATPAAAAPADTLLADSAAADGAAAQNADNPEGAPAAEGAADATKPDGDKQDEPQGAPEQYEDFTAPEGVTLDADMVGEFKSLAKDLNLSQADAQKVADLGPKMLERWQAKQAENVQATVAQWANDTRADKEIGGAKLTENLAVAKSALEQFGSPELKTLLNTTGLGNHPEVIRLLHKVGKATSEDKVVRGAASPPSADAAKSLYSNSQMN